MCCGDGDCCRTIAKVILIIVNVIFLLAGLLMLAFGIALVAAPWKVISILSSLGVNEFDAFSSTSENYFSELIKACGIFMIILGGVVAIIACFGFIGACCESKCMLVTYAVILIIIVLAEVALIIFAAVFPDKFESTGKKALYKTLDKFEADYTVTGGNFQNSSNKANDEVWYSMQYALKCCGVENHMDYVRSNFTWKKLECKDSSNCPGSASSYKVPLSCCKLKDPSKIPIALTDFIDHGSCLQEATAASTNQKGCANAGKDLILDYSKIAIGIAAGIVGLELILIALAIILACTWGDRSGKYV